MVTDVLILLACFASGAWSSDKSQNCANQPQDSAEQASLLQFGVSSGHALSSLLSQSKSLHTAISAHHQIDNSTAELDERLFRTLQDQFADAILHGSDPGEASEKMPQIMLTERNSAIQNTFKKSLKLFGKPYGDMPWYTPVRTIQLTGKESESWLKTAFRDEFQQDTEPVLIKGGSAYLMPSIMKNPLDFLATRCGKEPNGVLGDINLAEERMRNELWGVTFKAADAWFKLTGRVGYDHVKKNVPRNMADFIQQIQDDSSNTDNFTESELAGVRIDEALWNMGVYATGRGYQSRCPAIQNVVDSDPFLFAHPAPDEYHGGFVFGGHGGFAFAPLHRHNTWKENRQRASWRGQLLKYGTTVVHGSKTWVIYPTSEEEKLYPRNYAQDQGGGIDFFEFDTFLPEVVQKVRWPKSSGVDAWAVKVEKGDILLFPTDHVHHVHNDEAAIGLTFAGEVPISEVRPSD